MADGVITWGLDYGPVVSGLQSMDAYVTEKATALNAKLAAMGRVAMGSNATAGQFTTLTASMEGLEKRSQSLLTHLDRMSNVFTGGLGIGVAVGGFALLERAFDKAIDKARQFQVAQISIAASMSSAGYRTDLAGKRMDPQAAFTQNLKYAQDLQVKLLAASAKNHLTFQEQLGAFQSSLATGLGKGMNIDQIFKISNLGAMAAKSLGLHGEQIANATRLLMGGGVNVARSTIGRALGISNEDISSRSGQTLTKFLEIKLKGFEAARDEFGSSIEGVVSTLQSKLDTMLATVGMKFFNAIKPTLMHIIDATESPEFRKGGKEHANESVSDFKKRYDTFLQGQVAQDKIVTSLSQGFEGLYAALQKIVNSGAFDAFLKFLTFVAKNAEAITLGAVFLKIASSLKACGFQAAEFATQLRGIAAAGVAANAATGMGAPGQIGTAKARSGMFMGGAANRIGTTELEEIIAANTVTASAGRMRGPGGRFVSNAAASTMLQTKLAAQEDLATLSTAGLWGRVKQGGASIGGIGKGIGKALKPMSGAIGMGLMFGSTMIGGESPWERAAAGGMMGAGAGMMLSGGNPVVTGGAAALGASLYMIKGVFDDLAQSVEMASAALKDVQTRTPQGTEMAKAAELMRMRLAHATDIDNTEERHKYIKYVKDEFNATAKSIRTQAAFRGFSSNYLEQAKVFEAEKALIAPYAVTRQQTLGTDILGLRESRAKALGGYDIYKQHAAAGLNEAEAEIDPYLLQQVKGKIASQLTRRGFTTKGTEVQSAAYEAEMNKLLAPALDKTVLARKNLQVGAINEQITAATAVTQKQTLTDTMLGPNMERAREFEDSLATLFDTLSKTVGGINTARGISELQASFNNVFHKAALSAQDIQIAGAELTHRQFGLAASERKFYRELPYERAKIGLLPEQMRQKQAAYGLKGQELGIERAEYGLGAEELNLADQAAQLQKEERELKRKDIATEREKLENEKRKSETSYRYELEERPLTRAKQGLAYTEAAGAESLFYGGMGPISDIAGAIRYKVESEFAGQFNPAEYEAAYRQKIQDEIASMRIAKTEAGRAVTREPEKEAQADADHAVAVKEHVAAEAKIDAERRELDLDNLKFIQDQKKRQIERAKYGLQGQELGLKGQEYATEGKSLAIELGLASGSMQDFTDHVHETELGFIDQALQIKKSNMVYQDMISAQIALVEAMRGEQQSHGEKGNLGSLIPNRKYEQGLQTKFSAMDKVAAAHAAIIAHSAAASHMPGIIATNVVRGTHTPEGQAAQSGAQGGNVNVTVPVTIEQKDIAGLQQMIKQAIDNYCRNLSRRPQ